MVRFVKNRVEDILKKVDFKGKTVLELGAVGLGKDDSYGGENWLHGELKKRSKKVIGLDIAKQGINNH